MRIAKCKLQIGMMAVALGLGGLAAAEVRLAWNASVDPTVVQYNLYQGGASWTYTNRLSMGRELSVVASNLVPGGTYHFSVTAVDRSGLESAFSDEAIYTVPILSGPLMMGPPTVQPGNVLVSAPVDFLGTTDLVEWGVVGRGLAWLEMPATNALGFVRARMMPLTIERRW